MTEVWKPIPGYEGLYEVSDLGRVKSLSRPTPMRNGVRVIRERILKFQVTGTGGYALVVIYKKGKKFTCAVHRLVMLAFVGEPPDGHEVCHFNGKQADNRLSNLRYATRSDNRDDSVRLGTIQRGMRHWNRKMTTESVIALRAAVALGESRAAIAQRFGINTMTVGKIWRRESWRHVI